MSDWDNVVLDDDGMSNAQYSALAAGIGLMELPPEILAQPELLDNYIFGVRKTINDIASSPYDYWRQKEQVAETRLKTAQALTKETFLAMQQELECLELSIAKGEEHPNVDSRIAELEQLMEQSPWTLIPGEGCVPRVDVAKWIGNTASIEELLEKGSIAEYAKHYESSASNRGTVLIGDCAEHLASWAKDYVCICLRQSANDDENDIFSVIKLLQDHDAKYADLEDEYVEVFGNPVSCRP